MFQLNHKRALVTLVVAASATGTVAAASQPATADIAEVTSLGLWNPNSGSVQDGYGLNPYGSSSASPYLSTQVPDLANCILDSGTYKTSYSSPFWVTAYARTECTDTSGMHPPTTFVGMNVLLYKRGVDSMASNNGDTAVYVAVTAVCGPDNPTCAGVATTSYANSYISWYPPHVAIPNYFQSGPWGCNPNNSAGNWCSAVWGHQY